MHMSHKDWPDMATLPHALHVHSAGCSLPQVVSCQLSAARDCGHKVGVLRSGTDLHLCLKVVSSAHCHHPAVNRSRDSSRATLAPCSMCPQCTHGRALSQLNQHAEQICGRSA